jgi:hypothetical protein
MAGFGSKSGGLFQLSGTKEMTTEAVLQEAGPVEKLNIDGSYMWLNLLFFLFVNK